MAVYWASQNNSVMSLSRDSHVTKISKSNSERTIAVRAYYSHTYMTYESLALWALSGLVGKKSVMSLSRDSHVTKISKSNSERTITVRAYCSHPYESLAFWAFTGLVEKIMSRHYHVIVT